MDCDSNEVIAPKFDLACVQAGTQGQAQIVITSFFHAPRARRVYFVTTSTPLLAQPISFVRW